MPLGPRGRRMLLWGCALVATVLLWVRVRDAPPPPPPAPSANSSPRAIPRPSRAVHATPQRPAEPRALLDPEAVLKEHEGADWDFLEDDLGERGWLVVLARLPDGGPAEGATVRAPDCGLRTRTLADGIATTPPPPGTCRLTVDWSEPGRVCSWGPRHLEVPGGLVVGVDAELSCEARRDLGLRVSPGRGGWRVRTVTAGSPAAEAGLVPGAILLAVDGQPTDHLDSPEEWLAPPPSEPVTLTIAGTEGPTDVRFVP